MKSRQGDESQGRAEGRMDGLNKERIDKQSDPGEFTAHVNTSWLLENDLSGIS